MSPSLSRYLKDFSAEPPPSPAPAVADMSFVDEPAFPDLPEVPAIDLEAERRKAYAEGHEAATRELLEKHGAEMEAAAAAHAAELEALRTKYELEAAERIAARMRDIAAALGQSISAATAEALAPVMTRTLTDKAIEDLAALVTAAILDGEAGQITVSGPRDLFDSLAGHLADHADLLRHVEAQDVDLTVTIGESVLVTRMSAWADSLRGILE